MRGSLTKTRGEEEEEGKKSFRPRFEYLNRGINFEIGSERREKNRGCSHALQRRAEYPVFGRYVDKNICKKTR